MTVTMYRKCMAIWTVIRESSLGEIPMIDNARILHFHVFGRLEIYVVSHTSQGVTGAAAVGPLYTSPSRRMRRGLCTSTSRNRPQSPRPFHVSNGKEMFIGIRISHDADRVTARRDRC